MPRLPWLNGVLHSLRQAEPLERRASATMHTDSLFSFAMMELPPRVLIVVESCSSQSKIAVAMIRWPRIDPQSLINFVRGQDDAAAPVTGADQFEGISWLPCRPTAGSPSLRRSGPPELDTRACDDRTVLLDIRSAGKSGFEQFCWCDSTMVRSFSGDVQKKESNSNRKPGDLIR